MQHQIFDLNIHFYCSLTSSGLTSPDPAVTEMQDSDSESRSLEEGIKQSSPKHGRNEIDLTTGDSSSPDGKKVLDENANTTQGKNVHRETSNEISPLLQKEPKSKSSSSSESSRESDDTVISVEESDRDSKTQVQSKVQTKQNIDDTNVDKKEEREDGSSSVRPDLYLELSPAQNLQSKLSPISEGRESLSETPVTPREKPNLTPRTTNKANLHIEVPKRTSVIRPDKTSPALPRTPSNTPDLPRKQVVTITEPKMTPKSPTSECSSYGELSPPFSPVEERSKKPMPKSRKANLKGNGLLSH